MCLSWGRSEGLAGGRRVWRDEDLQSQETVENRRYQTRLCGQYCKESMRSELVGCSKGQY